jgi:hypothetical protein
MVRDSFVRPERHPEVSSGEDGHEPAMIQDRFVIPARNLEASSGEDGHESAI